MGTGMIVLIVILALIVILGIWAVSAYQRDLSVCATWWRKPLPHGRLS
jgi:hypothetical protein